MKKHAFYFLTVAALIIAFVSCKKEDDNAVHVAAPPHAPGSGMVSSVTLNGGNVNGRWTMMFEQFANYRNDTLVYYDSLTYAPGDLTVQFFSNGTYVLVDTGDTLSGSYSTSTNHLTIHDGPDIIIFTYGISSQGVMRWYYTETSVSGNDVQRSEADYLFERY